MIRHKIIIAVTFTLVSVCLLGSPALAHRKYRPHPKGLPRRILQHHTHQQREPVVSQTAVKSNAGDFDVFKVPFDLLAGAWKVIERTVAGVIFSGDKAKPTGAEKKRPVVRRSPNPGIAANEMVEHY